MLALGTWASRAADPPGTQPVGTTTRLYDIGQHLAYAPDFDDAPAFNPIPLVLTESGDRSRYDGGLPTRQELAEDLQRLIMATVDPDSWADAGGTVGRTHVVGDRLHVTTTPANHERIRELLAREIAARFQPVRVRAHWVLTRRSELDKLLKPVAKPGGALLAVEPADLDRLPEATVHFRAEWVCLNGQRTYATATRTQTAPSDGGAGPTTAPTADAPAPPPVVGGPDKPEAGASGGTVSGGLVLDLVNAVDLERRTAILTLRSQLAEYVPPASGDPTPARPATRPAAPGPPPTTAGGGLFSRPADVTRTVANANGWTGVNAELKTSVRVPLGRTVLIGGMTFDPSVHVPEAPQLYLFLEVTADE